MQFFQIVKMCAVVVLIFMVCWAPYHIYFIVVYHVPTIMRSSYVCHLFLFFYLLAMSNSCVNPIIYYWMNKRFRTYINKILCCVPCFVKESTVRTYRRASSTVSTLGVRIKNVGKGNHNCPIEMNYFSLSQDSQDQGNKDP